MPVSSLPLSGNEHKRKMENKVIKNASDEIDKLFVSAIKSKEETEQERKRHNKVNAKEEAEDEQTLVVKKKKTTRGGGDIPVASRSVAHHGIIGTPFIISPEAPLERIDGDSGLPVYKAHLLKVGEGGGTELCPFDCNCCF